MKQKLYNILNRIKEMVSPFVFRIIDNNIYEIQNPNMKFRNIIYKIAIFFTFLNLIGFLDSLFGGNIFPFNKSLGIPAGRILTFIFSSSIVWLLYFFIKVRYITIIAVTGLMLFLSFQDSDQRVRKLGEEPELILGIVTNPVYTLNFLRETVNNSDLKSTQQVSDVEFLEQTSHDQTLQDYYYEENVSDPEELDILSFDSEPFDLPNEISYYAVDQSIISFSRYQSINKSESKELRYSPFSRWLRLIKTVNDSYYFVPLPKQLNYAAYRDPLKMIKEYNTKDFIAADSMSYNIFMASCLLSIGAKVRFVDIANRYILQMFIGDNASTTSFKYILREIYHLPSIDKIHTCIDDHECVWITITPNGFPGKIRFPDGIKGEGIINI